MFYRFVSFNKKVSGKGNPYAKLVFLGDHDYNRDEVYESFIFGDLISDFESLNVKFGDLVDVYCDLKGIYSFHGVVSADSSVVGD